MSKLDQKNDCRARFFFSSNCYLITFLPTTHTISKQLVSKNFFLSSDHFVKDLLLPQNFTLMHSRKMPKNSIFTFLKKNILKKICLSSLQLRKEAFLKWTCGFSWLWPVYTVSPCTLLDKSKFVHNFSIDNPIGFACMYSPTDGQVLFSESWTWLQRPYTIEMTSILTLSSK